MLISELINQAGLIIGIMIAIGNFIYTSRGLKKKQDIDTTASVVKNATDLQDAYSKAFADFKVYHQEEMDRQKEECIETINKARQSIEEQERKKRAELLVEIETLKDRNTELKVQIAEVGGIVQGITGKFKWEGTNVIRKE